MRASVCACRAHRRSTERYSACYIDNPIATFYALLLPGIACVVFNSVLFVFITKEIRDTLQSDAQAVQKSMQKRQRRRAFRVYMSIFVSIGLAWSLGFIGSFLPSNADRFLQNPPPSDAAVVFGEIVNLLFNIAVPLQGFLLFESYVRRLARL